MIREYVVRIPVQMIDDTAKGAREVLSAVEKLAQMQSRAFEKERTSARFQMQRLVDDERRAYQKLATDKETISRTATAAQTRLIEQANRTLQRTRATELRDAQRHDRDKLRSAEAAARDTARAYDKHLGSGFFSRLGREASNAFKRSLNIDVTDAQGGGILGGALAVAGGNAITNILGKITGAISGTVKAGFDFNRLQEQTAIGFRVIMKDGEKALSFMRELQAFEKESPMDLPGVYTGAQRLMAMGFRAKEIIPILRAAGDAAAGLGKVGGEATAKVDSITLALGQMWQKGKVSAEEMSQQLVEQGIPAWRYLGDEIARTDAKFAKLSDEDRTAKVMKMAERNMLNARTAVAVIVKGMSRDFEGLGKEIAEQTASGLETNISSSFSRQMGTATAPAFAQYKKVLSTTLGALNSEVADKFVGGVSTGTGALFDAMEFTLKAVTTGDISGLGLNIANGLADGMKKGTAAVGGAARDLAQSGIDAAKDTLGIQSPSKVFYELGVQSAIGYGLGFQDEIKRQGVKILTREGDTFRKIAERLAVPLEQIMQRFPKDSPDRTLDAGLELFVPNRIDRGVLRGSRNKSISRDFLEQASRDPRVQAMLETLRIAEGGQPNVVVGGGRFDLKNPAHPGSYGMGMMGPKGWSTAAGNWQITQTNWKKLALQLGLNNFGDVHQQMIAALALYQQSGGLSALLSGDMQGAFKGTQPWAASPFSSLPGGKRKDFTELFNKQLVVLASGQGGLSSQEQIELASARQQISILQKTIDAYNARRAGQDLIRVSPSGDIEGGATPDFLLTATIPSNLTGAQKQNAINDDILQQRMIAQVTQLQTRVQQLEAILASRNTVSSAALDLPDFSNITSGQAAHVLDIFERARGAIIETGDSVNLLATDIVPRGLRAIPLPALAAQEAFQNLPPLIKEAGNSAEQFEKQMLEATKGLTGVFGDAFAMSFESPREALRTFRQDFKNWLIGLAKDYFESQIFKLLKGDSDGGFIGNLIGGIGKLFGIGKSKTSAPTSSATTTGASLNAAFLNNAFTTSPTLGGGRVGSSFGFGMDNATVLSAIAGMGGSLPDPVSLTQQFTEQQSTASLLHEVVGTSGSAATGAASAAAGKLGFGGQLAALAPMLGLSLGTMVGGQSGLGQILGGAGGLLAGGTLAAMFAPAMFGTSAFATSTLIPFLTNPFTIAAAGALLVGAYLINRNAQRRKDEKSRDAQTLSTRDELWKILRDVQNDQMDGDAAMSRVAQLKSEWMSFADTLKDSKTRRHHIETWSHFEPIIGYIKTAAEEQDARASRRNRMHPEFQDGGSVAQRFAHLRYADGGAPVVFNPQGYIRGPGGPRSDSITAYFPSARSYGRISNTEYVLDAETTANVGVENLDRLRASKGRAMASGGTPVVVSSGANSSGGGFIKAELEATVVIDRDMIAEIVIDSPLFDKAVVKRVKVARKDRKL